MGGAGGASVPACQGPVEPPGSEKTTASGTTGARTGGTDTEARAAAGETATETSAATTLAAAKQTII